MGKVLVTSSYLTDIANAIRAKLGLQKTYKPSEMAGAINSIPSGIDVSDTTASAANVLSGRYFYTSAGVKTVGTMTNRGGMNGIINSKGGECVIPQGYHNGSGKVKATYNAWSYTWTSTQRESYSTSQNFNNTKTYTATGNCIVVALAEVTGSGTKSSSITLSGGTTLLDSNIDSYRKLKICKLSNGDSVTCAISGVKDGSDPIGIIKILSIQTS